MRFKRRDVQRRQSKALRIGSRDARGEGMKRLPLPVKPRKGLKLVSHDLYVDKRGRTVERVTVWLKNDQSNAIEVEA